MHCGGKRSRLRCAPPAQEIVDDALGHLGVGHGARVVYLPRRLVHHHHLPRARAGITGGHCITLRRATHLPRGGLVPKGVVPQPLVPGEQDGHPLLLPPQGVQRAAGGGQARGGQVGAGEGEGRRGFGEAPGRGLSGAE